MVTNSKGNPLELRDPTVGGASLSNVAVDVDNALRLANGYICSKVTVFFPMFDLFLHSRIISKYEFHLILYIFGIIHEGAINTSV